MKSLYTLLLGSVIFLSCKEPAAEPSATSASIFPQQQISDYIRRIYQDTKGNLWLGTTRDGIYRYDGKDLKNYSTQDGLAGHCVKAIVPDNAGNLWIATEGGLSRFDGLNFTTFTVKDGLPDNDIWSVLVDKRGTVWVGSMNGLSRYDGGKFANFVLPVTDIKPEVSRYNPYSVLSIYESSDGNIWFGTAGTGIRKYDGHTITSYTSKEGLASNNTWCITQDRAGNMWIGTRGGGASQYDGKTFVTYNQQDGLAGNNISDIIQDRAGNIWLGTSGRGLSKYNGSTFTTITEDKGITQNNVQCMYQDNAGTLWVGFSGGLFRLSGSTLINVTKEGPWL